MLRKLRAKNGQAVIEFALVLPLVLLLLLGIIEISILFYDHAMITNASREGARVGIAFRANGSTYNPYSEEEIRTAVVNYLNTRLINFGGSGTVTVTAPLPTTPSPEYAYYPYTPETIGTRTVTVTYQHTFLVLSRFLGGGPTINMSAQTVMRLE